MSPGLKIAAFVCVIFLILAVVSGVGIFFIWNKRHDRTREPFAFAALSAIVGLTGTVIAAVSSHSAPWRLVVGSINIVFGKEEVPRETSWSEFAFFLMIYGVAVYSIIELYRRWDGQKSIAQYHQEQRSESGSIITEGASEIARRLRRQPPPKPYLDPDLLGSVHPLEPMTDSLAWKEQARDLLRFSSSSYEIDKVSGWHDSAHCWVGQNRDTKNLVVLLPAEPPFEDLLLSSFVSYGEAIAKQRQGRSLELIVAVNGDGVPERRVIGRQNVRIETKESLLRGIVDFNDYRNEIRRRVLSVELPDSALKLIDVYVHPNCVPCSDSVAGSYEFGGFAKTGVPSQNLEDILTVWSKEPRQRQIALLGEYGQGKSTAALMFTHKRLEAGFESRIPILIELRGTSPRNLTPLQLLGVWSSQYNINPQALLRLHIAGKLILIFEGFDEMALVGDLEMRVKHFKCLWEFCYPMAKILITGRPNFFLDEAEMIRALGIGKSMEGIPYCEAYRLVPFNPKQISEALRAHPPNVRDQISNLAQKNGAFADLVSRPSLLHIVSILWESEKLSEKLDKLSSAFVMDLFVRHSYRRQGLKQSDAPGFMALTTLEREFFMKGIAAYMAAKNLPNQITASQLNRLTEDLFQAMPDSVTMSAPAIAGEEVTPLRLRMVGSQYPIDHIQTDVRTCGLLVDDPATHGSFRFGHKSFMEYLFASVLYDLIAHKNMESTNAILKTTGVRIDHILDLPVAVSFLAELLSAPETTNTSSAANHVQLEISKAKTMLKACLGGGIMYHSRWLMMISPYSWNRFTRLLDFRLRLAILSIWALPGSCLGFYIYWSANHGVDLLKLFALLPLWLNGPILLICYCFMISFIYLQLVRRRFERRCALWECLCKSVDVRDDVLHRVFGTRILPWTKGKPFDYFS